MLRAQGGLLPPSRDSPAQGGERGLVLSDDDRWMFLRTRIRSLILFKVPGLGQGGSLLPPVPVLAKGCKTAIAEEFQEAVRVG